MAWKLGPEAIEIRREQQPFMPAGPQTSVSIKISQWFILENLLAAAPSWAQPFFYRTQTGAEVDLVLEFDPGSRWAVDGGTEEERTVGRRRLDLFDTVFLRF